MILIKKQAASTFVILVPFATTAILSLGILWTKRPVPILVQGNSASSNLILSLRGLGPLFDPYHGAFCRMPANGPPWFTDKQIQLLADWIDLGCPE